MSTQQVVCCIHEISVWILSTETQLLFYFKRQVCYPKPKKLISISFMVQPLLSDREGCVCGRVPGGRTIALNTHTHTHTGQSTFMHPFNSLHRLYFAMRSVQMAKTFCWSNSFNPARLRLMAQREPGSAGANYVLENHALQIYTGRMRCVCRGLI